MSDKAIKTFSIEVEAQPLDKEDDAQYALLGTINFLEQLNLSHADRARVLECLRIFYGGNNE